MAAAIFDLVATEIESRTDLARLEARGTVRLSLRSSGLDAAGVTHEQMQVVLARVLPDELASRGVRDAAGVCHSVAAVLAGAEIDGAEPTSVSPEDVFRRLTGR